MASQVTLNSDTILSNTDDLEGTLAVSLAVEPTNVEEEISELQREIASSAASAGNTARQGNYNKQQKSAF